MIDSYILWRGWVGVIARYLFVVVAAAAKNPLDKIYSLTLATGVPGQASLPHSYAAL